MTNSNKILGVKILIAMGLLLGALYIYIVPRRIPALKNMPRLQYIILHCEKPVSCGPECISDTRLAVRDGNKTLIDKHLADWFAVAKKKHPDFSNWVNLIVEYTGPMGNEEYVTYPSVQCSGAVLNATFKDYSCQANVQYIRPCEQYINQQCSKPFEHYERLADAAFAARQ
jgi:hypothetical protein